MFGHEEKPPHKPEYEATPEYKEIPYFSNVKIIKEIPFGIKCVI
jgi:hypothetical protein